MNASGAAMGVMCPLWGSVYSVLFVHAMYEYLRTHKHTHKHTHTRISSASRARSVANYVYIKVLYLPARYDGVLE